MKEEFEKFSKFQKDRIPLIFEIEKFNSLKEKEKEYDFLLEGGDTIKKYIIEILGEWYLNQKMIKLKYTNPGEENYSIVIFFENGLLLSISSDGGSMFGEIGSGIRYFMITEKDLIIKMNKYLEDVIMTAMIFNIEYRYLGSMK
jgi:hypothetical protein